MSKFMNIFYIFAKVQQALWVFIENVSKTPFSFLTATFSKGNASNKKDERKNYYKSNRQKLLTKGNALGYSLHISLYFNHKILSNLASDGQTFFVF